MKSKYLQNNISSCTVEPLQSHPGCFGQGSAGVVAAAPVLRALPWSRTQMNPVCPVPESSSSVFSFSSLSVKWEAAQFVLCEAHGDGGNNTLE